MLWDCGEGTQRQIFKSGCNFMRLSDIFITHWHADHFAGLLGLLETMSLEGRKKELRIYGPEADHFVGMLLDLGYSTKKFPVKTIPVSYDGTQVEVVKNSKEFCVQAIGVKHGVPAVAYALQEKDRHRIDIEKAKNLGLPSRGQVYEVLKEKGSTVYKDTKVTLEDVAYTEKGKRVVYSGDTKICSNLMKIAQGADLLIQDSTYFEEMERKHASLSNIVELVKKADVKKVVLTHFSRRYQSIKELEDKVKEHPNFRIGKDLMKVVVK
jgi:ribonuclease Z